jgi:hypothetical protein
MKNLDEELRIAMRRQEPAPDFTARVLARIPSGSRPRAKTWSIFLSWFQPFRTEWMAAAIAVLAILIAGAVSYRLYRVGHEPPVVAGAADRPVDVSEHQGVGSVANTPPSVPEELAKDEPVAAQVQNQVQRRGAVHRHKHPSGGDRELLAEGKKAAEQLRLALFITSAKLGLAQKAMQRMNESGTDTPPPDDQREVLKDRSEGPLDRDAASRD